MKTPAYIRFGALTASTLLAVAGAVAAENESLFTPAADPAAAVLQLPMAPARVFADPDRAILGANAPVCAGPVLLSDQINRMIAAEVARSRDSFIAAQAARDLRALEHAGPDFTFASR